MRLYFFQFIFKIYWTCWINWKLLGARFTNLNCSKVDLFWKQFIFLSVDDWVGMYGDEYLISFAMDPDWVVEIFVIVAWRELNKDVFTNSRWDHTLLVVLYLEEVSLRRQNMQSLGCRWVIDELDFESMCLIELIAGELDHRRIGTKETIGSNSIKFIVETQIISLFGYRFLE